MSFISGALNKSLFNKESYKGAIGTKADNGYAVVKIKPSKPRLLSEQKDPIIRGVLNTADGGFDFSVNAEYGDMGGIGSSILPGSELIKSAYDTVNAFANVAGAASIGAAYASKKIYKQSGFLTIKIPMMIVDWNGEGQPLLSAKLLAYYCLPKYIGGPEEIKKYIKEGENLLIEKARELQSSNKLLDKVEGAALETGTNYVAGSMNIAIDKIKELSEKAENNGFSTTLSNLTEGLEDAVTLRSSPVPVQVEIGRFFKHPDMVIESVNFSFSKEMTRMGPLYVKVDLSLSSRMIMTSVEDTGLIIRDREGRFLETSLPEGSNLTGY